MAEQVNVGATGKWKDRPVQAVSLSFIAKAVQLASVLTLVPLASQSLSLAHFSIFMSCMGILGLVGILDFGIGLSLINRLAHQAPNDARVQGSAEIRRAFRQSLQISFVLFLGAGCLAVVSGLQMAALGTFLRHADLMGCIAVALVVIAVSLPAGLANKALLGLGAAHISSRCDVLGQVVGLSGVLALMFFSPGVYFFLVVAGLPVLVGGSLAWASLAQQGVVSALSGIETTVGKHSDRRDRFRYFAVQLSVALSFGLDAALLTLLVGAERSAEFGVLMRMMGMIVVMQSLALIPLWPRLARVIGRGEAISVQRMQRGAYAATALLSLGGGIVFYLVGAQVAAAWTVGQVRPSQDLILVFSLWLAVVIMTATFSTVVNAMPTSRNIIMQPLVAVVILAFGKALGWWVGDDVGFAVCSSLSYFIAMCLPYLLLSLEAGRVATRLRTD